MIFKSQILLEQAIVGIVNILNGHIDLMKRGIVLAMEVEIIAKVYRLSL
jgi:hypothetical protein